MKTEKQLERLQTKMLESIYNYCKESGVSGGYNHWFKDKSINFEIENIPNRCSKCGEVTNA